MINISVLKIIVGWVGLSVVRFYPAYEVKGESESFIGTSIRLLFISIFVVSIVALFVVLIIENHIPRNLYKLLCWGIIAFIFDACFETLLNLLRIKRFLNWYSGFFVWNSIASISFGVLLVMFFQFGVEGLILGFILSVTFTLPFIWRIALGKFWLKKGGIGLHSICQMAKYSVPLAMGNLAYWILNLSDRYMLQFYLSSQDVGIYSISYKISEQSIMFIASLFAFAFSPLAIITWEREGKEKSQEFVARGTRYFLLLCIPAVAGISVLQEPIVRLLSTARYYEGARIIPYVAISMFFWGLSQSFGAGLSFYKKTQYSLYSLVIAGITNLFLNYLFISRYGYIAAALTTLVSYFIFLTLIIIFSRCFFAWQFPFKSLVKSICASMAMGTVVYFLSSRLVFLGVLNLILSIGLGGLIYFGLLFLFREVQSKEKQKMKQILAKCVPLLNTSK
jgi:O-antigen/teichoic acid export membrane protein